MPETLESLVREELLAPAPPAALRAAAEIRARHGASCAALLLYGSALRSPRPGAVLDFYALVDGYASAYRSRALALANAALPPNVFGLALDGGALRAKVAVISLRDFARSAAGAGLRPQVWARFAQPARAVWVRDAAAAAAVVRTCATAHRTAVRRGLALQAADAPVLRVTPERLWLELLGETYASEWRVEGAGAAARVYRADPARYARALRLALDALASEGALVWRETGDALEVVPAPGALRGLRREGRARRARRAAAKACYGAQLVKTAFTFGDWVSYGLSKLERHAGVRLDASARQRRHPAWLGWPLVWRALRRRALR